jgi:hypothetical protein
MSRCIKVSLTSFRVVFQLRIDFFGHIALSIKAGVQQPDKCLAQRQPKSYSGPYGEIWSYHGRLSSCQYDRGLQFLFCLT